MHPSPVAFCLLSLIYSAVAYQLEQVTPPVEVAESPFPDTVPDTVLYVDTVGKKLLRYDPAHPDVVKYIQFQEVVTPAVPIAGTGSLLVGVGKDLVLVDVDWGADGQSAVLKSSRVLATVDQDKPHNRFNDGKADPEGRLWIGTMEDRKNSRRRRRTSADDDGEHPGSLYRFTLVEQEDGNLTVETERVLTHLKIPNGMAWAHADQTTPGRRTYFLSDTGAKVIYAFRFDTLEGTLSQRRVVFNFTAHNITGAADGFTMDVDGDLWVADVHGGRVIRLNPWTGEVLLEVPFGLATVTCPEWGGPRRDVLYVTTGKSDASEADATHGAGSMFAVTGLGTRGRQDVPYRVRPRRVQT